MKIDELLEPADVSLASPAMADRTRTIRRDDLISEVAAAAAQLRSAGIGEHDRVAVDLGNDVDSVVRWLACLRAAGAVLALDPAITSYERSRLVAQFGSRATVSRARLERHEPAPGPAGPGPAGPGPAGSPLRLVHPPDDPLLGYVALATSGTSGKPKVVARELAAVTGNSLAWAAAASVTAGASVVTTTPLHHSYAMCAGLMAGLASGATVRILPVPVTLDLEAIPAAIAPAGRTVLLSIPLIYRRLLERLPHRPPPGQVVAISAGEGIDERIAAMFGEQWGVAIRNHLGTTELGHLTQADKPGEGAGRVIDGVQVQPRLVDDDYETELYWKVRGASPLYVEPGGVRGCLADGWFASGDLGYLDAAGRVWLTGRRSARISIAGRKIDPVEVETALRACPGVDDAAVTVLDGPEPWLCALIEASPPPGLPSLRRHLAGRLSAYKIPRRYLFVERLPKTAAGKLARQALPEFFHAQRHSSAVLQMAHEGPASGPDRQPEG